MTAAADARDNHSGLRVAVGQLSSSLDAAANRELVRAVVAELASHSPDLVVLPEATMHDFGRSTIPLGPVAEPLDGPFVETLMAAAAATGAVVVAGMFERRMESGWVARPYNTVVAVSPDGKVLARYRKLHLYDAFDYVESERLQPGADDPPVFDVGGLRVGIMTCYDLRFPETARLLADAGADVLLLPAAWVPGERKVQQWQALLIARAIENTAYVIGAGQAAPRYAGHSTIVDPMGVVLAAAGGAAENIFADLTTVAVGDARTANPSLANRRFRVVRR